MLFKEITTVYFEDHIKHKNRGFAKLKVFNVAKHDKDIYHWALKFNSIFILRLQGFVYSNNAQIVLKLNQTNKQTWPSVVTGGHFLRGGDAETGAQL